METKISSDLAIARRIFNMGFAYRAKLREMGYDVNLNGKTWYKGKYIGDI